MCDALMTSGNVGYQGTELAKLLIPVLGKESSVLPDKSCSFKIEANA